MGKFRRIETGLEGIVIAVPAIFHDARGFFLETYNKAELGEIGIRDVFVQDNQSSSGKGVIRGLHFQRQHPQVKLVRVLSGIIYDVVVDIRRGSPTYGRYEGFFLSADENHMLYVPVGFAHGFMALVDGTIVLYKVSDYYHPESDDGIVWNDPSLDIAWPLGQFNIRNTVVSEKDGELPLLEDIDSPFVYRNGTAND